MNCAARNRRIFWSRLFALACVVSMTMPAFAQDRAAAPTAKWRPKDGIYGEPGKDFIDICGYGTALDIDMAENFVGGNEWSCHVRKITDTAPGAIRIDMTCSDYNLAESIHTPEDKQFREIMLLRKIDEQTMFVRTTSNGKFNSRGGRVAYCPEEQQRAHIEAAEQSKAEAARKADEERRSKSDHPKDGVYASPGPDFNERCTKNDAIIGLTRQSISIGADKCEVLDSTDQPPDTVRMQVLCNENPDRPDFLVSPDGRRATVIVPSRERMMLKKIDDSNVLFWREENKHFTGPGRQLSYCSQDVQRAYAKQHAKK